MDREGGGFWSRGIFQVEGAWMDHLHYDSTVSNCRLIILIICADIPLF